MTTETSATTGAVGTPGRRLVLGVPILGATMTDGTETLETVAVRPGALRVLQRHTDMGIVDPVPTTTSDMAEAARALTRRRPRIITHALDTSMPAPQGLKAQTRITTGIATGMANGDVAQVLLAMVAIVEMYTNVSAILLHLLGTPTMLPDPMPAVHLPIRLLTIALLDWLP